MEIIDDSRNKANERFRKANIILQAYCNRQRTQEEVARLLGISEVDVGRVTRLFNYSHTIHIDPKDEECVEKRGKRNMCVSEEQLAFLDKYCFDYEEEETTSESSSES